MTQAEEGGVLSPRAVATPTVIGIRALALVFIPDRAGVLSLPVGAVNIAGGMHIVVLARVITVVRHQRDVVLTNTGIHIHVVVEKVVSGLPVVE